MEWISPRREGRGVSTIGDDGKNRGSPLPAGLTGVAIALLATAADEGTDPGALRLLGVAEFILTSSDVGKSIGGLDIAD